MSIANHAAVALIALMTGLSASAQPMTVVLKLKERVSMETLAQNVQNPLSARYHKYYSPSEIRNLAGPTKAQYEQLKAELSAQGMTIKSESPTHLWLSVEGDSAQFETLFATKIQINKVGVHQQMLPVTVPAQLSLIESVTGFDNTHKFFPRIKRSDIRKITPDDEGVPQATIKTAYGFDPIYAAGLSGKGQHIAVATYDGFHIENVQKFYSLSNLKPTPSVDQVAFNGVAKYDEGSAMETELDAEFTGMIAPGASVHVFASATNDDAGELQMFTAILDDNRAKVANYSWGSCENGLDPQHVTDMKKVFARAVAQGVNIMVASGDSGSDSCQNGSVVADWPAAAENIVAVGGTTFVPDQDVGLIEGGWSGSGGGISAIWDLPSWQAKLGTPYIKRSYPDVAFNADPASGQAIWTSEYGQAGWVVIGGTSMAAPQWSGFLALVGEARHNAGKAPVGYMNPIIYAMSDADRAQTFNDVTAGTNGAYKAGDGWDAVTGFGSMKADALLKYFNK